MIMVAVGFDRSESIAELESFREKDGGTNWLMATTPSKTARDFRVLTQSTKLIMDADGVVLYRANYGSTNAGSWCKVLDSALK